MWLGVSPSLSKLVWTPSSGPRAVLTKSKTPGQPQLQKLFPQEVGGVCSFYFCCGGGGGISWLFPASVSRKTLRDVHLLMPKNHLHGLIRFGVWVLQGPHVQIDDQQFLWINFTSPQKLGCITCTLGGGHVHLWV